MILENNDIMEAFNGYAPIFSISDFVMFPSTTYNFNIYESKYRRMVEDISKENKLFSIQNMVKERDAHHPEIQNPNTLHNKTIQV